jgi:hypothetical protein
VSTWLKASQAQFVKLLLGILARPSMEGQGTAGGKRVPAGSKKACQAVSAAAYKAVMQVVRGHPHFRNEMFERLVLQLLKTGHACPVNGVATTLLLQDLAYADVRIQWLRNFTAILERGKKEAHDVAASDSRGKAKLQPVSKTMLLAGYHVLMTGMPGLMPAEEEDLTSRCWASAEVASLKLAEHRKAFSQCWLTFLTFPMPAEHYKQILTVIHKSIIPHMSRPALLIDFLVDSYNQGGVVSLLALNGLFTLMQKHNLDYPNFYRQLYALFDGEVMQVKYRSRFFRMVDLFLSST